MRKITQLVLTAWIVGSLTCGDALARGGRGGGGGGGSRGGGGFSGGGGRPSGGFSPSMSRPSTPSRPSSPRPSGGAATRPAPKAGGIGNAGGRPSTGAIGGAGSRPSASQLNNFLDLPGGGGVGGGAGRPGSPTTRPAGANAAVADFLNNSGGARPNAGAGRPEIRTPDAGTREANAGTRQANRGDLQNARVADRSDYRSSLQQNRGDRRTDRQEQLGNRADGVRDQLRNEFDHDHLFDDFWADHPHAHYHFHQNPVFWSWATFATVSAFMPWNWGSPTYYDYGSGGNVVYEGDTVTAGDQTYTAEEYAQQAADIVASAPAEPPADPEWLPLGVFAMTQDGDNPALPNMFMQLAVSKEGIIAGTYQNKTTGKTDSIEGMVDKKSQRAAWTVGGKSSPIMETGIANLTQNETKALLHFADGSTQQWLMVRIEKPQDGAGQ